MGFDIPLSKKHAIHWTYVAGLDVMSFGNGIGRELVQRDGGDGLYFQYDEKTDDIVGVKIFDVSRYLREQPREEVLSGRSLRARIEEIDAWVKREIRRNGECPASAFIRILLRTTDLRPLVLD